MGKDLATHLLNEHDNEEMELAELRGVRGDIDLTGEFGRAAPGDDSDGSGEDSEGRSPAKRSKVDQYRRQKSRKRERDKDRDR